MRLKALMPPSIATTPSASVSAAPIASGHVSELALMAFPVWNSQMNAPAMMLSTPAAVGFQVLIRSLSTSRPSESSCQGMNRLVRTDATAAALAVVRRRQDYQLLIIGAVAFAAATVGYLHRKSNRPGDTGHIAGWASVTWRC